MRKVNPLEPQKIITMIILLMSTCIKVSAQSPYAMFGDNSKMLEAKRESVPSIYRVGVQSTNGVNLYADFDMNKGLATLYDAEGNILRQDSIGENTKAMFTTIDPHAESYYHLSPYSYCGGNPVNRIDPTGMDWVEGADGNIVWRNSVVSSNYQKVLNQGEIYRGVDYIRYMNWNNSRAVGLVQEHYLPNKTLSYEVHNGTYQFDFTGEVISSQELTGKQLGSNHAAKGIRGTAYLNAVFSDGGTYTTETYPFTSGPYGNGPTPNHNYTGSDFAYTSQAGMTIGGNRGRKVYMEDYNGRTGLRMHPDTNSPGTAGCIGIQGSAEALTKLGSFLYDYIKTQNKNIQINFIITGNPNYGNNGKANPYIGQ